MDWQTKTFFSAFFFLYISVVLSVEPSLPVYHFPTQFSYGVASASYQIEGAVNKDGRTPSIWDTFSEIPGKILDGSTGSVGADHYDRVPTDVTLLHNLGVSYYSFSLSWSRLFPTLSGDAMELNQKAVDHYSEEIRRMKEAKVQPFVTLFHWDLPQYIQDSGGWLNRSTVDRFVTYARKCFDLFGPDVNRWVTFEDPQQFVWKGYGLGTNAPGFCSNRTFCAQGNSDTDPYIAAHNILNAHFEVYDLYYLEFQNAQKGEVGIALNADWPEPFTSTEILTISRHLEFLLAWFSDPILIGGQQHGEYPTSMRETIGSRLPTFTTTERERINGSIDFLGLSHFTSYYVRSGVEPDAVGWAKDRATTILYEKNGIPIGPRGDSDWLYVYPEGLRNLLGWIHDRYSPIPIYITKSGYDVPNEASLSKEQAMNDSLRINYFDAYLRELVQSVNTDQINVVGYFIWTFLDGFEWEEGYSKRFGLVHVDPQNDFARTPKNSYNWYKEIVRSHKQYVPGVSPNGLVIGMIILALLVFIVLIFLIAYFWKSGSPQFETVA
eukprot:TRINITY_DN1666_c0_g1_i3.p1 TRINITY_DN1666_c0_g1~~TRINITY_DN1666_c0_g1_i3.p1  ORF type:complete len:550 (-),score=85.43 TRINITY_DN1666_c0_g1_i3:76-1725(-)